MTHFYKSILVLILIFVLTWLFLFWCSGQVFAYDYSDEHIQLTILDNGNWIIVLDGETYYMDWIDGQLRTAGLDGTCYWYDGEIRQCSLQEYSVFVSQLQ